MSPEGSYEGVTGTSGIHRDGLVGTIMAAYARGMQHAAGSTKGNRSFGHSQRRGDRSSQPVNRHLVVGARERRGFGLVGRPRTSTRWDPLASAFRPAGRGGLSTDRVPGRGQAQDNAAR